MRRWLKKLREKKRVSQQNVADMLNVSQQYYALIENGERQKKLSIELAQKLADVFGVTFEYICEQEKENKAR